MAHFGCVLFLVSWTGTESATAGLLCCNQDVARFETFGSGEDCAGVTPGRDRMPEPGPDCMIEIKKMKKLVLAGIEPAPQEYKKHL